MLVSIPLDDARIAVRGALDVTRSPDRLQVSRLPTWTKARSPEPAFNLMVSMSSGVRLDFVTTSGVLELDVIETGLQFEGEPRRRATIDVEAGGTLLSRDLEDGHTITVGTTSVSFVGGRQQTLRFDLGSGEKRVAIWLPQSAMVELLEFRLEADAALVPSASPRRNWAHYGSSISHGMEAGGPARTWPALAARQAGVDLINLGFAGQCHLDGFIARALSQTGLDLISLEIGANIVGLDTMRRRTFATAMHGFLDTVRDGHPETPIILVSPIYCGLLESNPGPLRRLAGGGYERLERPDARADGALSLSDAREILAAVVHQRRSAGDEALTLLDGLDLFGAADQHDMPDQLHPNPRGHETLGARFYEAAFGDGPFGLSQA